MTPQYTPEALRDIAAFLPIFEQEGFEFARLIQPPPVQPGVNTWPYLRYHPEVDRFLEVIYRHEWVHSSPEFQWTTWMQTEEATRLGSDPASLAEATPEQLARLLTIFARQERFVDGLMESFHESGLLAGILRRAAVLVTQSEEAS